MIYDCFLYYDEDMLLDIRLHTLANVVDKFVIVESKFTFTGRPKPLNFNIDKFKAFADKIIYVVNDTEPTKLPGTKYSPDYEVAPWEVEANHRNSIMQGLVNAKPDDIIIVSDVDEIFKPEAIKKINPRHLCTTIHQNFYNYQFNMQVFNKDGTPRKCTLPRATTYKNLLEFFDGEPETFRNIKRNRIFKKWSWFKWNWFKFNNKVIDNGGWHFSWVMTPERISEKMSTISHQEYNTPDFNNPEHIKKVLKNAEDIWGRDRKLVQQELKKPEFPEHLVDNKNKYKDFIM
ncbi:benzoate transporter [Enterobacter mori]|uniref:benzoate transporter n=1 Tax=Enterobacter mori TaxID=539813 RepID=UPI001B8A8EB3|nr:benzoate transporter [Enterobacter mori]MBS3049173.1 benzoate transporter [Enterobacter mori]